MEYKDLQISLINETWTKENCLIKREIMIRNKRNENDIRRISQIQVINWPDYSEPEKETGYLTLEQVLMFMQENICCYPKSPILLHCR